MDSSIVCLIFHEEIFVSLTLMYTLWLWWTFIMLLRHLLNVATCPCEMWFIRGSKEKRKWDNLHDTLYPREIIISHDICSWVPCVSTKSYFYCFSVDMHLYTDERQVTVKQSDDVMLPLQCNAQHFARSSLSESLCHKLVALVILFSTRISHSFNMKENCIKTGQIRWWFEEHRWSHLHLEWR